MGYDDDTRLACREILTGGLPTRLFLPLRGERGGGEFRPWGYGGTQNHEELRACADYASAALRFFQGNGWVDEARGHLLRILAGYDFPMPPVNGEPWSYLPDRGPNGDRCPAEVGANIYPSHSLLAWLTAAYAARKVGDTEVFARIKRHVGGRAALLNLTTVTCSWEGETGPHVLTVGNRSAVPITGRQDWWAARLRGEEPSAWSMRDGIIAEDLPALRHHYDLIAELGDDDSMLPPVACERMEVGMHGPRNPQHPLSGVRWIIAQNGAPPITSSRGRQDYIGSVIVGSVTAPHVDWSPAGNNNWPVPGSMAALGRGIGWQRNPRPWKSTGPAPPPTKPTPPSPPQTRYLTPADIDGMTASELLELMAADPRRQTWGGPYLQILRRAAKELISAGIKLSRQVR